MSSSVLSRLKIRRLFFYCSIVFLCKLRAFLYLILFSDNSPKLAKTKILQPTQFVGRGNINAGACQLGVLRSPGLLTCSGYIESRHKSAKVLIGDETVINNNFVIIADRTGVTIKERCLIGPNFFVCDSDFHGLSLAERGSSGKCTPVVIESDVFIGEGVKIMKGVTVGRGSVIGSGSVVVTDVESDSVYAGVPARKIKTLLFNSN
ncbi:acetyltransferase [Stutzerimonas stutzeri]|uniref:Acetyltransferase n=1 Tax=Stutzerimonas stutzeri TaxID=316 RepID=A0A2N8T7M5_STUST|nr:acyltransferase [Stutzerimonas stutzeri]MCQ4326968.1 acyltransferase [Stutzerimonas stutzeri]PNG10750.1 acetyltransferase [Stutzerimonas stutzeri]